MNDFMGSGGLANGGKLVARGRDSLACVKASWQPKGLSRLLWTHKNLPETGFGFQLELAAGLIVLELLPSIPCGKSEVGA